MALIIFKYEDVKVIYNIIWDVIGFMFGFDYITANIIIYDYNVYKYIYERTINKNIL